MTDPKDTRSLLHIFVVLGVMLLAVLILLGGTVWLILDDRGLASPPRTAAEHVERVVRTYSAAPVHDEVDPSGEGLTLHVVNLAGEPVVGMSLELDPQNRTAPLQVTTNTEGIAGLHGLPTGLVWLLRTDPEWRVRGPDSLRSTADNTVQTIFVERTCGGPVRVLDLDGSPFVGRIRGMGIRPAQWHDLDETGLVELEDRPCGSVRFRVIEPRGPHAFNRRTVGFGAELEGHELVEVQLSPIQEAVVQLVDEDGAPFDTAIVAAAHLGIGRFRVEGWMDTYRFSVSQTETLKQSISVPLDGGVHERVVKEPREVAVTLLCDDCPDRVFCGTSIYSYEACTGAAPDLSCTCPSEEGILAGVSASVLGTNRQDPHPLARLLPAETEKTVDVRGGRATIEGTWTGNVPCTATFAFEDVATPMTGDCDLDGSVFASDLFPGTWTLSIYDGSGVRAQRTVVLESHESRALGEIAPDGKNTGP